MTPSLFLLHLIGSPSSSNSGLSLKELFETCIEYVQTDMETETLFLNKISHLYGRANKEQLNNSISIVLESLYVITDEFPCLTHNNIPTSVTRVNYDILISDLKCYEAEQSIEQVVKSG